MTTALGPQLVRAEGFIKQSRAKSTRDAYRWDFNEFTLFCERHGVCPLPATEQVVCAYLASLAHPERKLKVGSIGRRFSSIAAVHKAAGYDSPTGKASVKLCFAGIKRSLGSAVTPKNPILTSDIVGMISHIDTKRLIGKRDRAILLFGFASALRRGELAALNVEDVTFSDDGARVLVRRSKTDQTGEGQQIAVVRTGTRTCPVKALEAWLKAAAIQDGAVFRSVDRHDKIRERMASKTPASVVKKYAQMIGLDPAKLAAHSLRSGMVSQAILNRVSLPAIQQQTRHRSLDMVMRYNRSLNLFNDNASAGLNL